MPHSMWETSRICFRLWLWKVPSEPSLVESVGVEESGRVIVGVDEFVREPWTVAVPAIPPPRVAAAAPTDPPPLLPSPVGNMRESSIAVSVSVTQTITVSTPPSPPVVGFAVGIGLVGARKGNEKLGIENEPGQTRWLLKKQNCVMIRSLVSRSHLIRA